MTSKEYNTSGKAVRRTKSAPPQLDQAPAVNESPNGEHVLSDQYRELVATEAYFNAERRGFQSGKELDDWLEAERLVKNRLAEAAAANNRTKSKNSRTRKAKDELSQRESNATDNRRSEASGEALEDNGLNLPKTPPHWSQGG